ncbi:MAG TPA: electron transfer flavoprotein subunit beta [Acetobacteraceae bacterium]|jgi:electron transfer flavoprotein beta subunit|nr:electron transfer flavoprotein subunit beta [Acetobacteraceae bacterium]
MNIVVLLSAGRHSGSGAARPVLVELQAIALGLALAGDRAGLVSGLHAGTADPAVADALGYGLGAITVLRIRAEDDPLPALVAEIAARAPDLVLAGRRGHGNSDSGLLPYRLAHACGWPIAADAVAMARDSDRLAVTQFLPRGARRRLELTIPAVVTVHDAAPEARHFVYRARLAGLINEKPGVGGAPAAKMAIEIRPYRARPRLIGDGGAGGSAEERLLAATETRSVGGRLMVNPDPDTAAAAILEYVASFRPVSR